MVLPITLENKQMSAKIEADLNTMQIKSQFVKDMWYTYLEMLGLDRRDALQRGAYIFVKRVMRNDMKVCLAFMVGSLYYMKMKYLLKESYNYYREDSDPKFTKASFEKFFNEHFTICELLNRNCIPYGMWDLKVVDYNEIVEKKMKFDLTVMNPPYAGKGDPLFMRIAKAFYDNCLKDDGRLVSINPTSVTDNTYDTVSAEHQKKYGSMRVDDFVYRPDLRTAFNASIGTGICITIFSKSGKYNLWSDFVKERRFGQKNWDMRKSIVVEKVNTKLGCGKVVDGAVPTKSIASFMGFGKWTKDIKDIDENSSEEAKKLWDEYMDRFNSYGSKFNGKNVVVLAYNRGHVAAVGEHKWDWATLQSDEYLKVQTHLPNMSQFNIPFETKSEAVNLIKWLNTDFIMYVVSHYKTQMTNNMILFKLLPQPPALDGNYSDEVLMKHFNLNREEMDWIHSEMKDFGWKVNLKKTESELMAHIDEINK